MHKPVLVLGLPIITGVGDAEEVVPPVLSLFSSVKVLQKLSQTLLGDINRQTHVVMAHKVWGLRMKTWWQKADFPHLISIFSSL